MNASDASARRSLPKTRTAGHEIGLDAAALIRQQASEIDSIWDRLTHAYMAMRGEVGDDFHIKDEFEELRRLARSMASVPPRASTK